MYTLCIRFLLCGKTLPKIGIAGHGKISGIPAHNSVGKKDCFYQQHVVGFPPYNGGVSDEARRSLSPGINARSDHG
jgi:hypothetical protein